MEIEKVQMCSYLDKQSSADLLVVKSLHRRTFDMFPIRSTFVQPFQFFTLVHMVLTGWIFKHRIQLESKHRQNYGWMSSSGFPFLVKDKRSKSQMC